MPFSFPAETLCLHNGSLNSVHSRILPVPSAWCWVGLVDRSKGLVSKKKCEISCSATMGVDGQLQVGKCRAADEWTVECWVCHTYLLDLSVGLAPSNEICFAGSKSLGIRLESGPCWSPEFPLPPVPAWANFLVPACIGFHSNGTWPPWPRVAWPGMMHFCCSFSSCQQQKGAKSTSSFLVSLH